MRSECNPISFRCGRPAIQPLGTLVRERVLLLSRLGHLLNPIRRKYGKQTAKCCNLNTKSAFETWFDVRFRCWLFVCFFFLVCVSLTTANQNEKRVGCADAEYIIQRVECCLVLSFSWSAILYLPFLSHSI